MAKIFAIQILTSISNRMRNPQSIMPSPIDINKIEASINDLPHGASNKYDLPHGASNKLYIKNHHKIYILLKLYAE